MWLLLYDYVEIANEINADGVHIGKNDMMVKSAREIGLNKIWGTANTIEDCQNLIESGVNYIGLGPFKFTETKKLKVIFRIIENIKNKNYKNSYNCCSRRGEINDVNDILISGLNGVAVSGEIAKSNQKQVIIDQFKSSLKIN